MAYSHQLQALPYVKDVQLGATPSFWSNIYRLFFSTQRLKSSLTSTQMQQLDINSNPRNFGSPLNTFYQLATDNSINSNGFITVDPQNEATLQNMTKEVVPFAKELIRLSAQEGMKIKIINRLDQEKQEMSFCSNAQVFTESQIKFTNHNFGLVFDIEILDQKGDGGVIDLKHPSLYARVAKLAESIGLTWAGNMKRLTNLSHFELRPAWGFQMEESDMIRELCRRKLTNQNLLAIL